MDKPALPVEDNIDHGIRLIEEERRRIARDLHDGPVQALTTISMRLDLLEAMMDQDPTLAKQQIRQLRNRIISAISEIRQLLYDLRPVAMEEVGLLESVRNLCEQLERTSRMRCEMQLQCEAKALTMSPARQMVVYRVIQELLNNARKHSQASLVRVALGAEHGRAVIEIQDDGIGFDATRVPAGHYGLEGIRERIAFLGGALIVDTAPGQGSRFTIQIPISTEEPHDSA